MKLLSSLLVAVLLLSTPTASAKLNGKNVVFVHGLQFSAILNPTIRFDTQAREDDVRGQAGPEIDQIVDEYLYYHSGERLQQNEDYLKEQIKRLETKGTCAAGCYFVTTSTGDLVTRYVLQQRTKWQIEPNRFWVIASFDIVGAGGGTELADVGVTIAEGNPISAAIKAVVEAFSPSEFWLAGIGYNLRPTIARQESRISQNIPRLRIAGRGRNPVYGLITNAIMPGGDDSVVPLHSACGANSKLPIYSCSQKREMGGKHVWFTSGPFGYMEDHFPILMARDMHHTQTDYKGIAVPLNNNRNFAGVNVSFSEQNWSTGWWWWKTHYTTINKPQNQTLVKFFINEFD